MTYRNLIVDMDDTLLPCGPFYVKVQDEFAEFQATRTGVQRDVCLQILKNIDLAAIAMPDAFNKERFPRSFRAASYALDVISGFYEVDVAAANHSFEIGHSVFDAPYDLFEGVRPVLSDYVSSGFSLFLLTKGDDEIQLAKIERNQLLEVFPEEHVYIVPKKNPTNIERIIHDHGLDPVNTIVIGDSLRDDIGMAMQAGVDSVWVHKNANKSWAYENTTDTVVPTHIIDLFTDLPSIIPYV